MKVSKLGSVESQKLVVGIETVTPNAATCSPFALGLAFRFAF